MSLYAVKAIGGLFGAVSAAGTGAQVTETESQSICT